MNLARLVVFAVLVASPLVACSTPKKPVTAAEVKDTGTAPSPKQDEAVKKAADENQGGGLSISAEIMKLCPGIKPPKFGYDSDSVQEGWKDAMREIAKCMKEGGLKGKGLLLTGHTDPRGDDEYNMALGGRRASSVKSALGEFGVEGSRIDVTSRGEVDAKGTEEATWSQDRRVDIGLRPGSLRRPWCPRSAPPPSSSPPASRPPSRCTSRGSSLASCSRPASSTSRRRWSPSRSLSSRPKA